MKLLTHEIRDLDVLDCWDLLEDYRGKSFDTAIKEVKTRFLQMGLSQEDISRVVRKVKLEPIRLE